MLHSTVTVCTLQCVLSLNSYRGSGGLTCALTRAIRSCKTARLSARLVALPRVSLGPGVAVVTTAVVATDATEGVVIMDATEAVSTDGVETAEGCKLRCTVRPA